MWNKTFFKQIVRLFLFIQIVFIASVMNASFADVTTCGKPDFDRAKDRGIFLWQNCGSGNWYLRVAGGGISYKGLRVEGSLNSNVPMRSVKGFSLEPGNPNEDFPEPDFVNKSDPKNISFRFRVWNDAQDGMDFKLPVNADVCLKVPVPSDLPVIVGRASTRIDPPINLRTLNGEGCSMIIPIFLRLLLD